MKHLVAACLSVLMLGLLNDADATESILDFQSDIVVHADSSMTVSETIDVNAEGQKIRRGIYRDFPTTYKDRHGNTYKVGFDVVSVTRNGQREDFHTQALSNGVRVYFGNKNRLLNRGLHEYVFTYRTNRQLGYFEQHDELYWNVTGNGWDFVIEKAGATVTLPPTVRAADIRVEGYTGRFGSKAQDYRAQVTEDGRAVFSATRTLGSHEGLTIVVGWPKGHVRQPTATENIGYLLRDNRGLFYMAIGLGLVFAYYMVVWWRVGRDQPEGIIVPLYYPPKGFSPASMRFIRRRGYDHKAFATALVNLAVKGAITLEEEDDTYKVHRNDDAPKVEYAAGEKVLFDKLLGHRNSVTLEKVNHSLIARAIEAHKQSLKRDYEKTYFMKNSGWLSIGILGSIATFVVGTISSGIKIAGPALGLSLWLSIWSIAVYFLLAEAIKAWRAAGGPGGVKRAVTASFFAGVFGFFEVMAIVAFTQFAPISMIAFLLLAVGLNVGFYHWLHADTLAGRKLIDKVEGFRQYLEVAEGDELKMRGAPTKTTDLFEMYLPYALALDVEQQWAERFANIFANLEQQGHPYHPVWYHGSHWHSADVGSFADTIGGSLSSAISSSSTAPGSSSGGGGGGSSGGGGGGGGGGGW